MPYDVNIQPQVKKSLITPGPWTQFIWDESKPHIRTIGSLLLEDHVFQAEMSEADANLVASAPEMLEALKLAQRYLRDAYKLYNNHTDKVENIPFQVKDAIASAIAKAEGRA